MPHKDTHITCDTCTALTHSIFSNLREKELQVVNQVKSGRLVKKGQIIFFEGDHVKGLHCICYGKVKLYKTMDNGDMQILRISKEADLIGYRGLLGDGKYIATAETIEDSMICFIPKHTILEMLTSNLSFSLQLMSKFASDLSEVEEKSIRFVQKSSKERLAEALFILEKNFGTTVDGYIQVNLTRQEIGAFAGLATETIIRTLKAWEEEGILELRKKLIHIKDKARLMAISHGQD